MNTEQLLNLAEKQKSADPAQDQDYMVCLFWNFIHKYNKDISKLDDFDINFFVKELIKKFEIEDVYSLMLQYEVGDDLVKKPEIDFDKIRNAIEDSLKSKGKI